MGWWTGGVNRYANSVGEVNTGSVPTVAEISG